MNTRETNPLCGPPELFINNEIEQPTANFRAFVRTYRYVTGKCRTTRFTESHEEQVQEYATASEAIQGHAKWMVFASPSRARARYFRKAADHFPATILIERPRLEIFEVHQAKAVAVAKLPAGKLIKVGIVWRSPERRTALSLEVLPRARYLILRGLDHSLPESATADDVADYYSKLKPDQIYADGFRDRQAQK